jgi:hypothetical protein
VKESIHLVGSAVGGEVRKGLFLQAEEGGQLFIEDLILVVEEILSQLHEVGRLLEAEV